MTARSAAAVRLLPLVATAAMLTFGAVAERLYVSSAGSAALAQQLDETCGADSALKLPIGTGTTEDEAFDRTIAAGLVDVDPPRRQTSAVVRRALPSGVQQQIVVFDSDGAADMLGLEPLADGEVALSRTNLAQLAVDIGDSITLTDGRILRVAQSFEDVPPDAVPEFWCGWRALFELTPAGDPPRPSAIASVTTLDRLGSSAVDEYRITRDGLTLLDAHRAVDSFDTAVQMWNGRYGIAGATFDVGALPSVVERADAVARTVARTTAPVVLTALVALGVVLVATSVLYARSRRRELHLLAVRGTGPWGIARFVGIPVPAALVVGGVSGALLATGVVEWFGPSSSIDADAYRTAYLAATALVALTVPIVLGTVAVVADRGVDRRVAGRRARPLSLAAVVGLIALAALAYRRLRRDGGIRTYGVESRGGGLLAMGFPLFTLLAASAAVGAATMLAASTWRLSGKRLPRAIRLGWRRVTIDGAPTAAIVVAAALAAGCLVTSAALVRAADAQLGDKADVYVGSDLSATVYGDVDVPDAFPAQTTTMMSARGRRTGTTFDLVGIDVATFAQVARLRRDAASLPLDALVDLVAQPLDGGESEDGTGSTLAPAIAVGSDASVGDELTLRLVGRPDDLQVRVVAVARWFPGFSANSEVIVVDSSVFAGIGQSTKTLLVRSPPDDAIARLRELGVRAGVPKTPESAFDGSAYSALRWAFAPLSALGLMFGLVAISVALLIVAARSRSRRAAHAVMRRTGFGRRSLFVAAVVEIAVPMVTGVACGTASAVFATRAAVRLLDPKPLLAPPARFMMPWMSLVIVAAAAATVTAGLALVITRSTDASDPMEAFHGNH